MNKSGFQALTERVSDCRSVLFLFKAAVYYLEINVNNQ